MPKPRPGEDRSRFITRCVSDAESIADFPNTQQRVAFCYAQYERYSKPAISKQFKQVWQTSVERERGKMERQYIAKLRKWYNAEYAKGVQQFIDEGRIIVQGLFPVAFLSKFYEEYYEETGLHFANWYFKNYKKFTKKESADQYQNQWRTSFASYGAAVAKTNVTLVQGTALKTLIALTTKLSRDPEWQALGAAEQARILRRQFDGYSKYQAERFIRTETTAISNKAILESATTIFPKDQLQKEWSTALDGRERDSHARADGQTVPFNQPFIVQGEELMEPGDRNGSASNVVNCRCAAIPVPIEDAVAVEGLENIGVQLAGENLTGGLTAADVASIAATIGAPKPKPKPRYSGPDQGKGEPLGDYLERTEHPGYSTWQQLDKMEKEGYDVGNLEFTKLLQKDVNLLLTNSSSYSDVWNQVKLNTQRFGKDVKTIVAHEYGHAIHNQLGWSKKGASTNKIVLKYFEKYQKDLGVGMGGPKITALKNNLNRNLKLSGDKFKELRKKFPNLTDKQYKEYWTDTADFLGAITRNEVGYGHTNLYYNSYYKQHAEFLAHVAENYYNGNPVFKAMFPKIYDETIQLWDELIKSI
jgi:hypothetical protein